MRGCLNLADDHILIELLGEVSPFLNSLIWITHFAQEDVIGTTFAKEVQSSVATHDNVIVLLAIPARMLDWDNFWRVKRVRAMECPRFILPERDDRVYTRTN